MWFYPKYRLRWRLLKVSSAPQLGLNSLKMSCLDESTSTFPLSITYDNCNTESKPHLQPMLRKQRRYSSGYNCTLNKQRRYSCGDAQSAIHGYNWRGNYLKLHIRGNIEIVSNTVETVLWKSHQISEHWEHEMLVDPRAWKQCPELLMLPSHYYGPEMQGGYKKFVPNLKKRGRVGSSENEFSRNRAWRCGMYSAGIAIGFRSTVVNPAEILRFYKSRRNSLKRRKERISRDISPTLRLSRKYCIYLLPCTMLVTSPEMNARRVGEKGQDHFSTRSTSVNWSFAESKPLLNYFIHKYFPIGSSWERCDSCMKRRDLSRPGTDITAGLATDSYTRSIRRKCSAYVPMLKLLNRAAHLKWKWGWDEGPNMTAVHFLINYACMPTFT
jgi:hypothetical protein